MIFSYKRGIQTGKDKNKQNKRTFLGISPTNKPLLYPWTMKTAANCLEINQPSERTSPDFIIHLCTSSRLLSRSAMFAPGKKTLHPEIQTQTCCSLSWEGSIYQNYSDGTISWIWFKEAENLTEASPWDRISFARAWKKKYMDLATNNYQVSSMRFAG